MQWGNTEYDMALVIKSVTACVFFSGHNRIGMQSEMVTCILIVRY